MMTVLTIILTAAVPLLPVLFVRPLQYQQPPFFLPFFVRHSWRSAHEGSLRDPRPSSWLIYATKFWLFENFSRLPKSTQKNRAGRARLSKTASKTAPHTELFTDCLGGRFTSSKILKIFCCQSTFLS